MHPEFVTALVYIGQAHMIQHNVDSMSFYFNRAQELYNGPEDDNAMGIMCNALAIHALYSARLIPPRVSGTFWKA